MTNSTQHDEVSDADMRRDHEQAMIAWKHDLDLFDARDILEVTRIHRRMRQTDWNDLEMEYEDHLNAD